jgi:holliday junction resolvase Hjr
VIKLSNKAKGSKAERELFQMFVDNHFRAVRVAGSGTMENADCDLIAGKPGAKYCIEAKSTKKTSKYISKEQMNSFIVFSEIFGLTPVIGVRFNRLGWFFLNPMDLEDSGKNWVINMEIARQRGKRFSQFFGIKGKAEIELNDYDIVKDMDYCDNEEDNIEDKEC